MIHLPYKTLNDTRPKSQPMLSVDPVLSAMNSLADIYISIQDDLSSICLISNLYLDMSSQDVQFISKLELLYGVAYNDFKDEIGKLSGAIELGVVERRYIPEMSSLKRLHPYENNLVRVNMMLLDESGNLIHRRF